MSWKPPAEARPYLTAIIAAETAYKLPQGLLARVLYQESRFREDIVTGETQSPAGAQGIAQFMPSTAESFGIDPFNPDEAIFEAARYLSSLHERTGSWHEALAAYNWGIGRVLEHGFPQAPKETRDYVRQITQDVEGL